MTLARYTSIIMTITANRISHRKSMWLNRESIDRGKNDSVLVFLFSMKNHKLLQEKNDPSPSAQHIIFSANLKIAIYP